MNSRSTNDRWSVELAAECATPRFQLPGVPPPRPEGAVEGARASLSEEPRAETREETRRAVATGCRRRTARAVDAEVEATANDRMCRITGDAASVESAILVARARRPAHTRVTRAPAPAEAPRHHILPVFFKFSLRQFRADEQLRDEETPRRVRDHLHFPWRVARRADVRPPLAGFRRRCGDRRAPGPRSARGDPPAAHEARAA